MDENQFPNLLPHQKERLEKWRKNTLPVKSTNIFPRKPPGIYVARSRDHGDDLSDLQEIVNQKLIQEKR